MVPRQTEGVGGEGEFGRGEHVEEGGVGGAEGGEVLDGGGRLVELDPHGGAWIVRVAGGRVGGSSALGVNNEPGFDCVDVAEGGVNGLVPVPGDLTRGYQVGEGYTR